MTTEELVAAQAAAASAAATALIAEIDTARDADEQIPLGYAVVTPVLSAARVLIEEATGDDLSASLPPYAYREVKLYRTMLPIGDAGYARR